MSDYLALICIKSVAMMFPVVSAAAASVQLSRLSMPWSSCSPSYSVSVAGGAGHHADHPPGSLPPDVEGECLHHLTDLTGPV